MMPSSKLNSKPKLKQAGQLRRLSFEAIGTSWSIEVVSSITNPDFITLERAIKARIALFDHHYSRFRSDSLVSRMSQKPGRFRLPNDAKPLLDLYKQLYTVTHGAMTPLVGQLLSDAGYDAEYSLQPKPLRATPDWETILAYDFPYLTLKQAALLDFGAAGKGYLVDIVAELVEAAGVTDFVVNAGGDIVQRNALGQAELVGLEHPDDPTQVIGIVRLTNQSICGSAGNRRAWAGYHHIIDPRTQNSPNHMKAVWVIAGSTLLADGLATALFFSDVTALRKDYDFQYVIINADNSVVYSENFSGEIFSEESVGA